MTAVRHHALRVSRQLWERYASTVGDRSADLKGFMAWRAANPVTWLAPDEGLANDFTATFKVPPPLWERFIEALGPDENVSAEIRRYIHWRVKNPSTPLPDRAPACV